MGAFFLFHESVFEIIQDEQSEDVTEPREINFSRTIGKEAILQSMIRF
jgi:hypothetical protein